MDGQRRLKAGSVLCIGAGGLGSPAAMYLAAAGVGRIGLVDFDVVDFSNLQRQILHGTPDVGRSKLASAKDRLNALNPHVEIDTYETPLYVGQRARPVRALRRHPRRHRQLPDPLPGERRLRAARQAERLRQHLPLRGAGLGVRDQGRAVLSLPVPGAAAAGPRAELRGGRRARRAAGDHRRDPGDRGDQADRSASASRSIGRFLIYDALKMRFRELKLRKDPDCPVCGTHPTVTKLIDYEQFCGIRPEPAGAPAGRARTSGKSRGRAEERLDAGRTCSILDVREPNEYQINRIAGLDADPARRAAAPLCRAAQGQGHRSRSARWAAGARRRQTSCSRSGSRG